MRTRLYPFMHRASVSGLQGEREDAPDARIDEVFRYQDKLDDTTLVDILAKLCEETCPELVMINIPF